MLITLKTRDERIYYKALSLYLKALEAARKANEALALSTADVTRAEGRATDLAKSVGETIKFYKGDWDGAELDLDDALVGTLSRGCSLLLRKLDAALETEIDLGADPKGLRDRIKHVHNLIDRAFGQPELVEETDAAAAPNEPVAVGPETPELNLEGTVVTVHGDGPIADAVRAGLQKAGV